MPSINYINKSNYFIDYKIIFLFIIAFLPPATLFLATPTEDLTGTSLGITALTIFIIAYALVVTEEFLRLRKPKPVIVAAGLIWILVGIPYLLRGNSIVVATKPGRARKDHLPIPIQRKIQAGAQ